MVYEHVEVEAHDHGHSDVLSQVQGLLEDEEPVQGGDDYSDILEARDLAGLSVSVGQRLCFLGQGKGDSHEEEQEPCQAIEVLVVGES